MTTTPVRTVTVIPPKAPETRPDQLLKKKLRVAAYCRVSSDKDEQLNSFSVQVQHYTEIISSNPQWKNAGIFADEGISGTSIKTGQNSSGCCATAMRVAST